MVASETNNKAHHTSVSGMGSGEKVLRSVNIRQNANAPRGFTANDQAWLSAYATIRDVQLLKGMDYSEACEFLAGNSVQVRTSFNFKSITVDANMVRGPGGSAINTPFVHNFISLDAEFSKVLIKYFEIAGVADMDAAVAKAERAPGFYAFHSRGNRKNRILEGMDSRFPLIWQQLKSVDVLTRDGIAEKYLQLEIEPVLNTALVEFSLDAQGASNGVLNSYLKMGSRPSKYRTAIELRLGSAEDLNQLAELLRGKLDASAVA